MNWCSIVGDVTSDIEIEAFPDVTLCDQCVAEEQQRVAESTEKYPDSWIRHVGLADPGFDTCYNCGKTVEMEEVGNQLQGKDVGS